MTENGEYAGAIADCPSADDNVLAGTAVDSASAPCPNCGMAGSGDGVLRPGQLWCGDENCAVVSFLGGEQC